VVSRREMQIALDGDYVVQEVYETSYEIQLTNSNLFDNKLTVRLYYCDFGMYKKNHLAVDQEIVAVRQELLVAIPIITAAAETEVLESIVLFGQLDQVTRWFFRKFIFQNEWVLGFVAVNVIPIERPMNVSYIS